ncbi:hypothetical protein FHU30_003958 [Actinomadura rupiterrae]|nr:hypothetical protein [Actinomadura rupiterrae]
MIRVDVEFGLIWVIAVVFLVYFALHPVQEVLGVK